MILGFDFGGSKVDIGVGTSMGDLLDHRRLMVQDFPNARAVVGAAVDAGVELQRRYDVAAIGVSTMGITLADGVALAPNVLGWAELRLPSIFQHAFPNYPIAIDNDVRAACSAEMLWGSMRSCQSGIYLNLGTGIAMALVFNGGIWQGMHGAAGEIAYLWEMGQAGYSRGHAPFEERYGGRALDHMIQAQFPMLGGINDLLRHQANSLVYEFTHRIFRDIARHVGHVLLALDVEMVSVGGGVSSQFEVFAPIFEVEWNTHLPYPPRLVPSVFRHYAGLYGAFALASRREGAK